MAYFKSVEGKYINYDSIENTINYICNPDKTISGLIGGLSVIPTSVDDIITQFKAIKQIYHNGDGKQVLHFVLSLEPNRELPGQKLLKMAMMIAAYYAEKYQIVYAIHEDKIYQHIHFVMNTVSFKDGKKLDFNHSEYYGFMDHVAVIINLSCFSGYYKWGLL